jgi:SsrA-binding protein
LVPLKIYLKHGKFKVQVGIVRGKKQFEKREAIKRRDLDREAKRDMGY